MAGTAHRERYDTSRRELLGLSDQATYGNQMKSSRISESRLHVVVVELCKQQFGQPQ
jgi:hypothetical protein